MCNVVTHSLSHQMSIEAGAHMQLPGWGGLLKYPEVLPSCLYQYTLEQTKSVYLQ